jgi:hypothetical protein
MRDDRWSESIAVGNELGFKADHRDVIESDGSYVLREPAEAYALKFAGGNEALRSPSVRALRPLSGRADVQQSVFQRARN